MPRDQIGTWISEILPIQSLVPEEYQRWRPLVQDAIFYVFTHLSEKRLAPKIASTRSSRRYPLRNAPVASYLQDAGPAKAGTGAGPQPPPRSAAT